MGAIATWAPPTEVWMELLDRKKLAKLMLIQEVSQRQVAEAAGWRSHSYLGRLLRGEAKTLENDHAVRIAHFLGVGTDDLFVSRSSSASRHSGTRSAA
ncbi:MAG TPA: helix-turn-helix transcriptional regulator [Jiangellaceae bacterium]|nr:helix-turn-helix transcriptional regulator [Jiangellaceae bacterium]